MQYYTVAWYSWYIIFEEDRGLFHMQVVLSFKRWALDSGGLVVRNFWFVDTSELIFLGTNLYVVHITRLIIKT